MQQPPDAPSTPPRPDGSPLAPPGPPTSPTAKILIALGVVLVLVGIGLGAVLSSGGSHETSGGGKPVALVLSLDKGDVYHFTMTLGIDLNLTAAGHSQPISGEAHGPETMRVIRRDASGAATLVITVGPLTTNMDGQQQISPAQTLRLQIARDGRVVSGGFVGGLTQAFGGGANLPGTEQFAPLLPHHKVAPGDSWDTTVNRSMGAIGSGSLRFTAHSTYLRNETIHGVEAAVISSTAHVPMNFSIDFSKIAAGFGGSSPLAQLPAQMSDASLQYTGSADITTTSWLDLARHQVEKIDENVGLDVGFSLQGTRVAARLGEIRMQGSMTFGFERVA
jgi:hypothetical protein